MPIKYLVRTPFGNDGEGFHKAMKRIRNEALDQLALSPVWLKGRDKKNGRYHYWEVENKVEAYAFLLAFGDQIQEHEVEHDSTESNKKNMVKDHREQNGNRNTDRR